MKSTVSMIVFYVGAGVVSGHAQPSTASGNVELTVRVVKLGMMQDRTLNIARRTAEQLFARIGVGLRFTTEKLDRPDKPTIDLLVMKRAPAKIKIEVMGADAIDPELGPAVFVFYDRVARFYQVFHEDDTGVLMGYVIAHDLGHALQQRPSHSKAGVMKAPLDPDGRPVHAAGRVWFSKEDSRAIYFSLAHWTPVRMRLAAAR